MDVILSRLKAIDNDINLYYDLGDDETSQLFQDILDFANKNRVSFVDFCRDLPLKQYSVLSVIYSALSTDEEDSWASFFYEEVKRVFDSAKKSNEPELLIECLEDIDINDDRNSYHKKIISFLCSQLNDSNPGVRYAAIELLHFSIDEDNVSVLDQIKYLLKDEDRKVRRKAHEVLSYEDYNIPKNQIRLPWKDRFVFSFDFFGLNTFEITLSEEEKIKRFKLFGLLYLLLLVVFVLVIFSDLLFMNSTERIMQWSLLLVPIALAVLLNYVLMMKDIVLRSLIAPSSAVLMWFICAFFSEERVKDLLEQSENKCVSEVAEIDRLKGEYRIEVSYFIGGKRYEKYVFQDDLVYQVGDYMELRYSQQFPNIVEPICFENREDVEKFNAEIMLKKAEIKAMEEAQKQAEIKRLSQQ